MRLWTAAYEHADGELGCSDGVDEQLKNLLLNFMILAFIETVQDDDRGEFEVGCCLDKWFKNKPLELKWHRTPSYHLVCLDGLLYAEGKSGYRSRKLVCDGGE
jgi:hypothetical protein